MDIATIQRTLAFLEGQYSELCETSKQQLEALKAENIELKHQLAEQTKKLKHVASEHEEKCLALTKSEETLRQVSATLTKLVQR